MAGSVVWAIAVLLTLQISHITANSCGKFAAREVFAFKGTGTHIAPLEQGLSQGFSVTVEGRVHGNTSTIEISLLAPEHKRFDEQASLALQVKFNLAHRIAVLNSFLMEKWGTPHTIAGVHLQSGRHFKLTIESEEGKFKILTDGKLLATHAYQFNPLKVSHVRVSGDVTDVKVTYSTSSPSCRVNPELRTKVLQFKGAAPYVSLLDGSLIAGTALSVVGKMHSYASWMLVNLQSDGSNQKFIALQFNPRVYENATILNTFKDDAWGHEQRRIGTLPVHRSEDFVITFHCSEKEFKICVNGIPFTTYRHRIQPNKITKAYISGDITLLGVLQHSSEKALSPHTTYCHNGSSSSNVTCAHGSQLREHFLQAPKPGEAYNSVLIHGFERGSVLVFSGTVENGEWGAIDLMSNSISFIPLHFNLRFNEKTVVRNSMIDARWGVEEREGDVPFQVGKDFNITIKCEQDYFKIDVNGKQFTTYKHRVDSKNVRSLHVRGVFHLKKITYFTPEKC
ncbi:32 kDa beta-galactoside-binding lectin-like isoform X1 [Periplaneta americana]|uniref:32 kDa beta-galactoside-binding lectin-like isoform X1 n=1 Tax=Periplaneta americana TaxID=6978 RepID=UPI0037E94114